MPEKEEKGVEIVGKQKKGVVIVDKNTKSDEPPTTEINWEEKVYKETSGPC